MGQGMAKEWAPSWVGQQVTGSSDWRLRLEGLKLALALDGRTYRVATQPLPCRNTGCPSMVRQSPAQSLRLRDASI